MIKQNHRGELLRFEIMSKKIQREITFTCITKSEKIVVTKVEILSLTV